MLSAVRKLCGHDSTGPTTVFVAVSVANLEHTLGIATRIGAIGISLLVLVLATVTWLTIGRTLAPVDAIRARYASAASQVGSGAARRTGRELHAGRHEQHESEGEGERDGQHRAREPSA